MTFKVSDYLVKFLESSGVTNIFMISGGGIMHLVDSVGKSKKIKYVCNQNEQASAIAAESYARIRGLGVCLVTTGPGGTNALTGVAGAWLDSIPVLYISGQVNMDLMVQSTGLPLRQLGDQEINIVQIVKPITKYAVTITDPREIKYELQKAIYIAKSGRPGPVWVDIPLNIQGSYVSLRDLRSFDKREIKVPFETNKEVLTKLVSRTIVCVKRAKRPVILAGNGIRLAGAANNFLELVELLKVPVLSSFAGFDLIDTNNHYYIGRPGIFGQRVANFAIQNSDLLVSIGSRLNIRIVTYNSRSFAREAFKIVVDIDRAELKKPTIKADIAINFDAKDFIKEMISQLQKSKIGSHEIWLAQCKKWKDKYPVVLQKFKKNKSFVNSYSFVDELSNHLKNDDVLVLADGAACTCTYQTFKVKQGQRVILNSGCAAMGYGFPAAIGVCFARKKKRVICLEGDGSVQLNIQELQTMKYYNLPIKLFIYNNDGYHSIRSTQDAYFNGRYIASNRKSGVSAPNFLKVAQAYGFRAINIKTNSELSQKIKTVMEYPGPVVCTINMDPNQPLIPKVKGEKLPNGQIRSKPLEDMYPFLPRDEFKENMLVKLWKT